MHYKDNICLVLDELRAGRPVIVMDPKDRENEGDLIMAAEFADRSKMAFFVNNTTGIICCSMTPERAQSLNLELMVKDSSDPLRTAFTITVDSVEVGTGVSADERAKTLRQLADYSMGTEQFRKPGHIFPLISRPNGVLERMGHTEASVDLLKLANMTPVAVIAELVNLDGSMKRFSDCKKFACQHNLKMVSIEEIVEYIKLSNCDTSFQIIKNSNDCMNNINSSLPATKLLIPEEKLVHEVSSCQIPITINNKDLGFWKLRCFSSNIDGRYHITLEKGDLSNSIKNPVMFRVHSECFTGDTLGSQCCDCGAQLFESLNMIEKNGRGLLMYYSGHEGRGIGIASKIRAYYLQQSKFVDTYKANQILGYPDDQRVYDTAIEILKVMNISQVILLSNNYKKFQAFQSFVKKVVPVNVVPNVYNERYLHAKSKYSIYNNELTEKNLSTDPNQFALSTPSEDKLKIYDQCSSLKSDHSSTANSTSLHKSIPLILLVGHPENLHVSIVYTIWNQEIVDMIVDGITKHLTHSGVKNIRKVDVPGSFEIPYAAKKLINQGSSDVIICVGLLLKGETMHFELLSESVVHGLMDLQINHGVPIVNSVLNCLNMQQALDRASSAELSHSIASTAMHMAEMKINNLD